MSSIINATTTAGVTVTGDNSGSLQLATNNGTTAVTIDTSQNVGIGTSSPSEKLEINNGNLAVGNAGSNFTMKVSRTGANASSVVVGAFTNEPDIQWTYTGSGALRFTDSTASAERMRITSAGDVCIGTTSVAGNQQALVVRSANNAGKLTGTFICTSSASSAYGIEINYSALTPNNTGSEFYIASDSSATRFQVRSNGGIANYSGNNVNLSDAKEKTNVELAGNYLSKICSIPVKTFNYIDQNREDDDGLTLGVIAQDVQAVAPELVSESDWSIEKDGSKMRLSIYQTDLQFALMKSIQELKAELDATKAEVQALKGVA